MLYLKSSSADVEGKSVARDLIRLEKLNHHGDSVTLQIVHNLKNEERLKISHKTIIVIVNHFKD